MGRVLDVLHCNIRRYKSKGVGTIPKGGGMVEALQRRKGEQVDTIPSKTTNRILSMGSLLDVNSGVGEGGTQDVSKSVLQNGC